MVIRWSENRNIMEASYSLSRLTTPSSPDPLSDLAGLKQLCCSGSCSQVPPPDDMTGNKSSSGTTSPSVSPGPALASRGQPALNFSRACPSLQGIPDDHGEWGVLWVPRSTEGSGGSLALHNIAKSARLLHSASLFFYSILSSFSRFEELLEQ